MADLRTLNAAVQKAPGANAQVKAWIAQATDLLEPPAPPVGAGSLLGLYVLGDGSQGFQHVSDGLYALNIGPWPSRGFLASLKGIETMVYTVAAGTPGADPAKYTVLDPANPAPYISTCKAYVAGTGVGIFLDNALLELAGLTQAIQQVGEALRAVGVPFGINLGSYVAGDSPDADDGQLWIDRVEAVGLWCSLCMLENWQQFSGGPSIGENRTDLNGGYWSSWQRCPAAAKAAGTRFVGVTYGGDTQLTWGRASLLTAPGVGSDAVLATGAQTNADPYDPVWTKADPQPVLDQATGTATL